jgi:hypothetical protein
VYIKENAMFRNASRRLSRTPVVDGLESRGLLSGGAASVAVASFHGIPTTFLPAIKGTIHGVVTGIAPISATSEVVTYTARGKANIIGDGKGFGQHTIKSKALKNHTTSDTYSNGSATVIGTTDTVAIRYTGAGHTNTNGSWTATWKGTARSVAGQHSGLSGSFSAQLSGDSRSGEFTINLTIKV